jgi:hypothetical protein
MTVSDLAYRDLAVALAVGLITASLVAEFRSSRQNLGNFT